MGIQASVRQGEGDQAGGLLRSEIARAKPASSLDLGSDPRFISLRSLAQGNLEAERLAGEVYEQHEKLVRAERRTDLLSGLSKSDTSMAEAEAILDEVKLIAARRRPGKCGDHEGVGLRNGHRASGDRRSRRDLQIDGKRTDGC